MLVNSVSMADNRAIMKKNAVMTNNVNFKGSPINAAKDVFCSGAAKTQKNGIFSRIGLMFQDIRFKLGLLKPTNIQYGKNGKVALKEYPNGAFERFRNLVYNDHRHQDYQIQELYYMSEKRTPSGVTTSWKPKLFEGHYSVMGAHWDTNYYYYVARPLVVKKEYPNGTVKIFDLIKLEDGYDTNFESRLKRVIHPDGSEKKYSIVIDKGIINGEYIKKHYVSYTKTADGIETFIRPNGKLEKQIFPDGTVINYGEDGGLMEKIAPDKTVLESNVIKK